jgi:hypothetical protein
MAPQSSPVIAAELWGSGIRPLGNIYVLTASQSYGAALKATGLGHGLLTYTLVEEGLKTAAADTSPRDGLVDIREWLEFAVRRVPVLAADTQGKRGFPLDDAVSRQTPRVFFRRERDRELFVVAAPQGQ